jgi:hypothetical protein
MVNADQALIRRLERLADDRWMRLVLRRMLSAVTAAALAWCVGLLGHAFAWWPVSYPIYGAVALGCLLIGAATLIQRRPPPGRIARLLDQRFGLQEQLSTALEVGRRPWPGALDRLLLDRSLATAGAVRRDIARRAPPPWPGLAASFGMLLLALGLTIMQFASGPGRLGATDPLGAPLTPAEETSPFDQEAPDQPLDDQVPPPEGFGDEAAGAEPSGGDAPPGDAPADPRVAAALAEALRQQGVTRPAAEALDAGDPGSAAQQLRDLADRAGELSDASRLELSQALRDARRDIAPVDPARAEEVRRSADQIEAGGPSAAEGLERLADMLDALGTAQDGAGAPGAGAAPGTGAGNGGATPGDQRPAPPERLGVPGKPLELEAGDGTLPADGAVDPGDAAETSAPGITAGGQVGDLIDAGADPLRVPLEERDVVQEYFRP